mmetsp:Transcript_8478/g.11044  ORF Transcript_8478/g.11044 Transcript_8478/m.11044 type:complete len:454 (+) Transcript_8478:1-1362(+)
MVLVFTHLVFLLFIFRPLDGLQYTVQDGEKTILSLPIGSSTSEQIVLVPASTMGSLYRYNSTSQKCSFDAIVQTRYPVRTEPMNKSILVCYLFESLIPQSLADKTDQIVYEVDGYRRVGLLYVLPRILSGCFFDDCHLFLPQNEHFEFQLSFTGGWHGFQPSFKIVETPQYGELYQFDEQGTQEKVEKGSLITRRSLIYQPFLDYFNTDLNKSTTNLLGESLGGCLNISCPDIITYVAFYAVRGTVVLSSKPSTLRVYVYNKRKVERMIHIPSKIALELFKPTKHVFSGGKFENKNQDLFPIRVQIESKYVAIRLNPSITLHQNVMVEKELMSYISVTKGHRCIFQNCLGLVEIEGPPTAVLCFLDSVIATLYDNQVSEITGGITLRLYDQNRLARSVSIDIEAIATSTIEFSCSTCISLSFIVSPIVAILGGIVSLYILSESKTSRDAPSSN